MRVHIKNIDNTNRCSVLETRDTISKEHITGENSSLDDKQKTIYQLYFASVAAQYKNTESTENTNKYKLYTEWNGMNLLQTAALTVSPNNITACCVPRV